MMDRDSSQATDDRTRRQITVLVVFGALLGFFLFAALGAIGPFVITLVVAYFMAPVVDALQRRRVPRWAGILLIFLVFAVCVIAVLSFIVPLVARSIAALDGASRELLLGIPAWLASVGAPAEIVDAASAAVDAALASASTIGAGGLLGSLVGVLFGVLGIILSFAFAPFFIFYLLIDAGSVVSAFDRGIPHRWRADIWAVISIANRAVRQWLRATVLQGLVMGGLSWLSMLGLALVFGSPFSNAAILLTIVSFFSEFIPIIGPLIPLVMATVIGLSVSPEAGLAAFIVFAILQQIEANIVAPRIEGEALALHPALVLAVLILGLAAFGVVGALFATVFASIYLITGEYVFRRVSGLIDPPTPPPAPEPRPLDQGVVPGIPRVGPAAAGAPAEEEPSPGI
jgi:predicted PurR-regulated permease PerM